MLRIPSFLMYCPDFLPLFYFYFILCYFFFFFQQVAVWGRAQASSNNNKMELTAKTVEKCVCKKRNSIFPSDSCEVSCNNRINCICTFRRRFRLCWKHFESSETPGQFGAFWKKKISHDCGKVKNYILW